MPGALIYSERAYADLSRLKAFLAGESPHAAQLAIERIISGIDILQMFPQAGVQVNGRIRRLIIKFGDGAYVVRYAISGEDVIVLRIWHAREKQQC